MTTNPALLKILEKIFFFTEEKDKHIQGRINHSWITVKQKRDRKHQILQQSQDDRNFYTPFHEANIHGFIFAIKRQQSGPEKMGRYG